MIHHLVFRHQWRTLIQYVLVCYSDTIILFHSDVSVCVYICLWVFFVGTQPSVLPASKRFGQPKTATTTVFNAETCGAKAAVTSDNRFSTLHTQPNSIPGRNRLKSSMSGSRTTTNVAPKLLPTQKRSPPVKISKQKPAVNQDDLICCNIKFTRMSSFERHINRKHHEDVNNDGVKCLVCGKVFLHRDNLLQHQKSHKKKKNKKIKPKFICNKCKTSFTKKTSLIRHFSITKCNSK